MIAPGTVLKGRWRIARKIGQGAFGEIFAAVDLTTQDQTAIKAERWESKKAVLKLEVSVLKRMQGCPQVCKYLHCGHFEEHNYLVMELLGMNLSELRRRLPSPRQSFSPSTTVRLVVQMIQSVAALHNVGYLHRDIKPSNFAIGASPQRRQQCIMIDFGLARKYRLPNGQIRPARDVAGFRGTARYASLQSHQSMELSRADDLWSIFYVFIEFYQGHLPWRKLKSKEDIGEMKKQYHNASLVAGLPPVFFSFMEYLMTLQYKDTPDYEYLVSLVRQLDARADMQPYDWEGDATVYSASFVDMRDGGGGGSARASEELGIKEWGKDSDDAVDGAGSVLSSGALVSQSFNDVVTPRGHSIEIPRSSLDSGRQHSQSVPSMPVAHYAAQHQPISIGQRVIAKSLSFNADSAPLDGLADFSPPPQTRDRGLSGASVATTRENTHASPRVIGDAAGGTTCAIAELPSRSHEQKEEAGVAACTVEVEVQDRDAGCGTQGPGLESQGADLNDADQAKCMPCVVM